MNFLPNTTACPDNRFAVLDARNQGVLGAIFADLDRRGHFFMIVGGAVRDALLGRENKDTDVEVYGISYDELHALLERHGRCDLVGREFGVIKFRCENEEFDFSIPRRESRMGAHHRDFKTEFDAAITPKEAASRRDFTINAMGYDPMARELHDYFGGQEDILRKLLVPTSDAFAEDALRVLRGMQFACRFGFEASESLQAMSRRMLPDAARLSKERVCEEWMKWTRSEFPGRVLPYLIYTNWIGVYPELCGICAVRQDPQYHPEGDVDVHTGFTCDFAARIADRENLEGEDRAVLLFALLCHDLGKATHTEYREVRGEMRWTSPGHEKASGPLARKFLESIGIKESIIERVVPLVEEHMVHAAFEGGAEKRVIRRLAKRLFPASIEMLVWVVEADCSGRPPLPPRVPESALTMLEMARDNQVEREPQKPLIQGRDVLPYFVDQKPGPHIGVICKAALQAQEDGAFSNKEDADRWLYGHMLVKAISAP